MWPPRRCAGLAVLMATLLGPLTVLAQSPGRSPQQPQRSLGDSAFDPAQASVLRQRAWHDEFMPNSPYADYGYRNPGNVGRYAEYYPPGNQFQNPQLGGGQRVTARIGLGGVPDRAEQIAAYNSGTARYNAIQTHIDRFGRPLGGFGLGFGFGFPN